MTLAQVPIQNEVHTSLTWHNKKYWLGPRCSYLPGFCTRSDAPLIPNYVLYMVWKVWIIDFQITRYKNERKKEKEFYMDWKLERSLSEMTCKKQILALVSFTALETKRNLGHVNFSKEFWDCYWGPGKTNSWIARPQRWFHLAQFPFLISKWPM